MVPTLNLSSSSPHIYSPLSIIHLETNAIIGSRHYTFGSTNFVHNSCTRTHDPTSHIIPKSNLPSSATNNTPLPPPHPPFSSNQLPKPLTSNQCLNPQNTHSMTTRSKNNVFTSSKKINISATTTFSFPIEPTCVSQAMKDRQWRQAMSYEFDPLIRNGT